MSKFVHLHVHTHYSLLDGLCKIPRLVDRTVELGMDALAVTDHGNLHGAIEFQSACKRREVKPIFGCEISVVHDAENRPYHLVLLARNAEGYRNLVKLVSVAQLESFGQSAERGGAGREPYVLADQLGDYASGLVALTADLGGAIPQAFLRGQLTRGEELLSFYREVFGDDHVFLELQRHEGLPEQDVANRGLIELASRTGLPLVATADCHYVLPEYANAHAVLNCIGIDKRVDIEDLDALPIRDLYLRSPDEMASLFHDYPEAVENTVRVAELCNAEIPTGHIILPDYAVPEGHTIESYFEQLARKGLEQRIESAGRRGVELDRQRYLRQLEHEIQTIEQMGYPGYFLIVWDFIAFAKRQGIPVGPGRGSGAGSVVAWALRITNIDPLRYGLLFERFLNPERVSMPDFDIDFCMNRRGEVIEYVSRRYGENNVGQIITFGQLKARACIRDVGRVLNFSYGETDRLAKLIPAGPGVKLEQAYNQEPRLREAIESDERVGRLFDLARALEGTNRNAGMHAAGIVISDVPLWDMVPVTRGAGGELVTQFAKDEVEQAGLVKFDFLGLRNLTVIADAVRLVNEQRGPDEQEIDIESIPLDNAAVFQLISTGDTTGIFQLESSGFQELLRKLRPNCFEDIIAAGALYRPGPLSSGMVDDFIDCKHGIKEPEYPHPWVEDILRETYGVIVYQEQVMQIAQVLAGYTLGGADLLRRAMGKKKPEVMAQQRDIFLAGAKKLGVNLRVAGDIFDKMAAFAGYGFNKSHSAAYAMVTYQTAYLKTHHPVHFMAALMTNDSDRTERVVRLIHEAKDMGIEVRPPDVNHSRYDFTVKEGRIRFGLGAIKGVGQAAIDAIVAAREEEAFASLFDFCERVDLHRVNRRVIETLVKCGAFDAFADRPLPPGDLDALGAWRSSLFATIGAAFDLGQKAQNDRDVGQGSLDLFAPSSPVDAGIRYIEADPWSDKVLLEAEKECLGFYVSGHPLDRYEHELHLYTTHDCRSVEKAAEREEVRIGGVIGSLRERRSRQGDGRHAFAQLEDRHGRIELLVFSRVYCEAEDILKQGLPILASGTIRIEGDEEPRERKLVCDSVQLLTDARLGAVGRVVIQLTPDLTEATAHRLRDIICTHQGDCPTFLSLTVSLAGHAQFRLPDALKVKPTDELLGDIEQLLGRGAVSLAL